MHILLEAGNYKIHGVSKYIIINVLLGNEVIGKMLSTAVVGSALAAAVVVMSEDPSNLLSYNQVKNHL